MARLPAALSLCIVYAKWTHLSGSNSIAGDDTLILDHTRYLLMYYVYNIYIYILYTYIYIHSTIVDDLSGSPGSRDLTRTGTPLQAWSWTLASSPSLTVPAIVPRMVRGVLRVQLVWAQGSTITYN